MKIQDACSLPGNRNMASQSTALIYWVSVMRVCVCVLVTQSCPTLQLHGLYVACQTPLTVGFSRQESWSRLPCPPPGDLPSPGIEPRSLTLQADSLPSESPGKSVPDPCQR